MKTIAKLFRWLRGEKPHQDCPDCLGAKLIADSVHPFSPAAKPRAPRTRPDSTLSVVEKLDALPRTLMTTLRQREIAELAGCAQSGVSVYRRARGLVPARSYRRRAVSP